MKKFVKAILPCLAVVVLMFVALAFSGCGLTSSRSIVSVEKTSSNGLVDTYTIYYTDGTKDKYTIKNGADGKDGENGQKGEQGDKGDSAEVSVEDLYAYYKENVEDISYTEFLKRFVAGTELDNSAVVSNCLRSCMKVYTEFTATSQYWSGSRISSKKATAIFCGSSVIFDIDDEYVYAITNYHVVYYASANEDNGGKIARKIVGYLYGSEDSPIATEDKDDNGYDVYDYGAYGIEFEYVGGSALQDIAVLRAKKADVLAVNPEVAAVQMADGYEVGETAIAIGNPENYGISVTEGVVSVDNEFITLSVDGTSRQYRSIRIDTSIYGGSSGGGLFNKEGKLIGITNAGNNDDENINYAIPIQIVKNTIDNILYYYDGETPTTVKKMLFGISVESKNSKYVYDADSKTGKIVEDVMVKEVNNGSIAKQMEIEAGDQILSITVNETKVELSRYFEIGDLLLLIHAGDKVSIEYKRGGEVQNTAEYTVLASDIN